MRQTPRVSVNVPVILHSSGQTWKGWAKNVSLGGAFVTLALKPEVNEVVSLRFTFSPPFPALEALARVVRTDNQGVGVEFLDLDVHSRALLHDFLISYWPRRLTVCPFCGRPVPLRARKRCPACRQLLNWRYYGMVKIQESEEMIGTSEAMRRIFSQIRQAAATDLPVLILGPPGSGKEMVARAIHQRSHRATAPFLEVNCGTIPREYLEAELFGQEKENSRAGRRTLPGHLERAQGGTLFLEEVGQLPLELQGKLLNFIQDYTFLRVGGQQPVRVDLRLISATDRDLKPLMAAGSFREDLFHRLGVMQLCLPPLKERGDDALIMAHVFLKRYATKLGKDLKGFTPEAAAAIQAYDWPGNVRELINRIRRAVVLTQNHQVGPEHLALEEVAFQAEPSFNGKSLKEARAAFEARLIGEALRHFQGNVQLASKALRVSRSTMYHFIQKYHLKQFITMSAH